MKKASPIGSTAREASARRAARSPEYRDELRRLEQYEEVARSIIHLRMKHEMTQEVLACRIGTTKSAISRLESGQHRPNVETLGRIAQAFGYELKISFRPASGVRPRHAPATVS